MDSLTNFLTSPLGIVLVVLVVAAVVALVVVAVRRGRGRTGQVPPSVRTPPVLTPPTSAPTAPVEESTSGPAPPAEAAPVPVGQTVEEAPSLEVPESVPSRLQRLRARLAQGGTLGQVLLGVLSRGDLGAADWEELEDSLLVADLGMDATDQLMERLRTRTRVEGTTDPRAVRSMLAEELLALVDPSMDRSLHLERPRGSDGAPLPASILVVGVNGTGKTTTVGKLARILVAEGDTVLLGAADTFRAAAADQLTTWGQRVGVDVVRSEREGADPASVAFDAVKEGAERGVDVVMVDTAGRLQTKSTLMDELGKVKRVMERQAPVNEVLLVLDATTGQNGMRQAQVFAQVVDVTGIVLTKLDGTAKGGIVVSVQKELGVPVKFVGLGEGADDLAPFDPQDFVNAIVGL